jgi:transcriptional regulator GlxA family with amidase domain
VIGLGPAADGGRKVIAFAAYPGLTPLDLVGPLSALRDLKIGSPYRTVVVAERLDPMPTDTALGLVPSATFADVPHPYGVVVPGGGSATERALEDPALIEYVRSAARTAELVGATGNGALVLAAAGLLRGRRAAIHWAWGDRLEQLGGTYAPDRWVEEDQFLTAAGGSAGIDAMLHLVERLKGEWRARLTQLMLEYDRQPPFGRDDRSAVDGDLAAVVRGDPRAATEGSR